MLTRTESIPFSVLDDRTDFWNITNPSTKTFNLTEQPIGKVITSWNGLVLSHPLDFTISSNQITIHNDIILTIGDWISFSYSF